MYAYLYVDISASSEMSEIWKRQANEARPKAGNVFHCRDNKFVCHTVCDFGGMKQQFQFFGLLFVYCYGSVLGYIS